MLSKLGWEEGQPLGLSPDARVDPIPFSVKQDFLGLGKQEQDSEVIIATVSQRRELDSERQIRETHEQRQAREMQVALLAGRQEQIASTLKPFYCQLCDKPFKNVTQYDEHTNSYAHHHKARAKDMQASLKPRADQDSISLRREKEKLREDRVLRKIARAAGVKIAKGSSNTTAAQAAADDPASSVDSQAFHESKRTSTGWLRVGQGSTLPLSTINHSSEQLPPPPPPPESKESPPPPPPAG